MNCLVIHDSASNDEPGWPWPASPGEVSIRHLHSTDLPLCIAAADFIAVAVSCGLLSERWRVVEKLLVRRNVPMLAFEPMAVSQLAAIRRGGTCTATLNGHGCVELQCRAQQSAFQRIEMARRGEEGGQRPGPLNDANHTTRFIFQGK